MPLEDFLKKDPKPSRTRRVRKKDKKKLDTIPEPPTHVQEVPPSEPKDIEEEVPLVWKKSKTPTEKGVTFKEPLPPKNPKVTEFEGKGKDNVIEPMPKKKKLTHTPSQPPAEPEVRFRVDIRRQLSLHARAGPLGQGISMDSVNRVFHSMNILGGDIWDRITDGSPDNLNELGIHTAVVVSSYFHKSFMFLNISILVCSLLLPSLLLSRTSCPRFAIMLSWLRMRES